MKAKREGAFRQLKYKGDATAGRASPPPLVAQTPPAQQKWDDGNV